jgi:PAS domain S-box-containing protein
MDKSKEMQSLFEKISAYETEIEMLKNENKHSKLKIEKLEKLQQSFEEIISKSTVPIISGNKKGQIIDANDKALKITQLSMEEILRKNIKDIFQNQNVPKISKKISGKEKNGEISNEQILVKKNGKKIFVRTHTKLMPDNSYQILIKKIHRRKKAELELAEVKYRYEQLAENIDDVIWTSTLDLKILYISGTISKITGFNPEAYYQKPLNELMTPISYQLLIDTMSKENDLLMANPKAISRYPLSVEISLLHKHHSKIWVELSIALIQNQFGEIVGLQGIIRNIDAQKKTQEILDKSNQKYNFAIKSVGSGVWELNADLTWIGIDENLLNILGYNGKKPKSMLNDWINLTYKEDRIIIIDILQDILDGKKKSDSYDCRRIHKDGNIIWFTDYVEGIYDDEGNIIEILGTSKNITNEKLTEEKKFKYYAGLQILIESTFQFLNFEKLDQIYNYAGHILVQKIPESIIIFSTINSGSNEIFPFKYFGVDEPGLLRQFEDHSSNEKDCICKLSAKAYNFLNQKFIIEFKKGFGEFLDRGNEGKLCSSMSSLYKNCRLYVIGVGSSNQLTEAILIITKDGSEIYNKEFIEAFISLSFIIIDKKKIELELIRSNETKDKFFSIISHDLKNPFNTFIGFSSLIINNIDKISREKILEFAKLIHNTGVQNYEMMSNLFVWVKSQKGSLQCTPEKLDISGLILSNINLFSSEAQNESISIEMEPGQEKNCFADLEMMNTILRNLISNAIKFTNNGGQIKVSCKKQDKALLFSVKDNGIGMTEEKQKELFQLSKNTSTLGTNKEKGTGLGLILCFEFVNMHGGSIWVESEEGKGTEFLFTIPLTS